VRRHQGEEALCRIENQRQSSCWQSHSSLEAGSISRFPRGTATDPQGAVIAGATVTLVDTDPNKTMVSTTDGNGICNFNALPPASYRLTVERDGFTKKVLEHVQIIPEQLNSRNLPGAGTSYGGDGTKVFLPPSYVQGPAFPAISPAPLPGIQRNVLNRPGYSDVDASLAKGFGLPRIRGLGENAKFEIRANFYNLFNKANINVQSIDSNPGSVSPTGAVTPNSDFGVAGSALGSRTAQLQARFSF
jgi:Carboxypeptidase regulatory-like domain/TonB dependent receptor